MFLLATFVLMTASSATWFGGEPATFDLPTVGNPYDPEQNDVQVRFTGPHAAQEGRLAYYAHGHWHVNFAAKRMGTYLGTIQINGRNAAVSPIREVASHPIQDGFIRVGGPWGFRYDSGKIYWPFGHNLAWQSGSVPLSKTIQDMGAYGANWARVWASFWDGKNPMWHPAPFNTLDEDSLDKWDAIVKAAQAGGVSFQFVLFHHGPWSSNVDSNWAQNPWNTKNGGFLKTPNEFFTNSHAKKLAKEWLRYAVARYGDSPAVLSWELFNEVQWVDAIQAKDYASVRAWHEEMTSYLKQLDPYNHLVTSSSDLSLPVFSSVDYYQPHSYPVRIRPMLLNAEHQNDKPVFFGEIGLAAGRNDAEERQAIRDGIWTSLFRHFSGAAEYWYWDKVIANHFENEYKNSRKILDASGALKQPDAKEFFPNLEVPVSDLILQPSGGWEPVKKYEFRLPQDANALAGTASYFQGVGHRDMRSKPLSLLLNLPSSGTLRISFAESSGSGGNMVVRVDGTEVARKTIPGGAVAKNEEFMATIPGGRHTVELDNDGPDWVRFSKIVLPGLGKQAEGSGSATKSFAILRVTRTQSGSFPIGISELPLLDGRYHLEVSDLDSGLAKSSIVQVNHGTLRHPVETTASDMVIVIKKHA